MPPATPSSLSLIHIYILVYVERPTEQGQSTPQVEVFQAPIHLQGPPGREWPLPRGKSLGDGYLGRVIVGISNDTFSSRQQEILMKAGVLSLFALLLTFLLARRLARQLAQPLSAMGQALERIPVSYTHLDVYKRQTILRPVQMGRQFDMRQTQADFLEPRAHALFSWLEAQRVNS